MGPFDNVNVIVHAFDSLEHQLFLSIVQYLFPDRDVELIKEVVFAGHYTDLVVSIFQGQQPIFLFFIHKYYN